MESEDLYSQALFIIADLTVEICGNKLCASSQQKALAKEAFKLIIEKRVVITEQLLEKLRTFLSKLRQSIEPACKEIKAIAKEVLDVECLEATTGFIGRLGEFVKLFIYNCVLRCSGQITTKELVSRTRSSVDDLMRPSAEPLKYAGIGAGVGVGVGVVAGAGSAVGTIACASALGASFGSVIPVAGTIVGGVVGGIVGTVGGVVVGSTIGVAVARKNEKSKKLN